MLILGGHSEYIEKRVIPKFSLYFKDFFHTPEATLKSVLRTKSTFAFPGENSSVFNFRMPYSEYCTAVLCDFSLFFARAFMQRSAYLKCHKLMPRSWSFVTLYYMGFFSAVALARLIPLCRSYMFVEPPMARTLSELLTLYSQEKILMHKGSYFVDERREGDETIVSLSKTGSGAHEAAWSILGEVFKKHAANTSNGERDYIAMIVDYTSSKFYSPSKDRNEINYFSDIVIRELQNEALFVHNTKLSCAELEDNLMQNLLAPHINTKDTEVLFFEFIYNYACSIFTGLCENLPDGKSELFERLTDWHVER